MANTVHCIQSTTLNYDKISGFLIIVVPVDIQYCPHRKKKTEMSIGKNIAVLY